MPWSNVPKSLWPKMERCVKRLMSEGKTKDGAIKICHSSVVGKELDKETEMSKRKQRASRNYASKNVATRPTDIIEAERGEIEDLHFEIEGVDEDALDESAEQDVDKKSWDEHGNYMPTYGATSFAELAQSRSAAEMARSAKMLSDDLVSLIGNISYNDDIDDKPAAIKRVADEYAVLIGNMNNKEISFRDDPIGYLKAKLFGKREKKIDVGTQEFETLTITKDAKGEWRWLGISTNNFEDTDREILTSAAHKEFCRYLDENRDVAPLFVSWHELGTARKSQIDFWDYTEEGFFVVGGSLTEEEAAALTRAKEKYRLGMSHGFFVLERDPQNAKHITKYRTFEVSDLPIENAANPWTDISAILKEANMALSEAKRKYLVELYGEDYVKTLESNLTQTRETLTKLNVTSKEAAPDTAPVSETPAAETPAPAPEETPAPAAAPAVEGSKVKDELADRVEALEKQNKSLAEIVERLQKSTDDQLADLILPPLATSKATEGKRLSQAKNTELKDGESAPEEPSWVGTVNIAGG